MVFFGFLVADLTERIQHEATAKQAQGQLHAASGSSQFDAGYDCMNQAQPTKGAIYTRVPAKKLVLVCLPSGYTYRLFGFTSGHAMDLEAKDIS